MMATELTWNWRFLRCEGGPACVVRQCLALVYAALFFALAMYLSAAAISEFFAVLSGGDGAVEQLVKSINYAIVGIAVFELAVGVHAEYASSDHGADIFVVLRRSIARFVSVVCVALSLEGLIMAIKYSQLNMAGNLYYPVAIVASAAVLLMGLGVFLRLTAGDAQASQAQSAA